MKKIFSILFVGLFILISCHKQEYYQTNPNAPTTATPSLLLTGICEAVFNTYPTDPAYASRYIAYYERPTDAQNYGWETKSFYPYTILRQVKQMEKLATIGGQNQYLGVAKFFRAVLFSKLTDTFGDVPYTQALQGEDGIDKPSYDTQESIYKGLLAELEEGNQILSNTNDEILGDIIFGGNTKKWQKAINAYRLRLLIHLSKKADNANLNVKQQFADILNDPIKYPLMENTDDNAQLIYNTTATNNYYPTFNNLSVTSLVSLEKGLTTLMKDRLDQRLFQYGDPIVGKMANDFANYEGVDAGLIVSDQQNAAPNASKIHRRFVTDQVNQPMTLIGYSEQELIIAEGIARGWSSGEAKGHYINGIRSSMQSFGIGGITIEQYLNRPLVKYDAAKAVELIAIQKYLAMFMHADWEPFFEQRRTGFPTFSIGLGTLNNGKIPKRWRYPLSEFETNKANVEAAVARQFAGGDNVNAEMWLLQ
jgi:hypothetical protein